MENGYNVNAISHEFFWITCRLTWMQFIDILILALSAIINIAVQGHIHFMAVCGYAFIYFSWIEIIIMIQLSIHMLNAFNSLGLSVTIWPQQSRSTLAQVMACCSMAQAFTWTSVDLSSVSFSDNHLRAISQGIPHQSITKIGLKIPYLKFHSNLPGANELNR